MPFVVLVHEPLAVVVPAYNAEPTLAKVVKDVRRNLPGAWIIGVDDGSTDGSRQLLRAVIVDDEPADDQGATVLDLMQALKQSLASAPAESPRL